MKITYKLAAVLAGASLLLCSCVVDGVYGSFGVSGPGYNASVSWSNASYDDNGFPIFGYSYGRPVYGYTAAGAAVFSFAALTALCFVPHWGPAPWYHGPWRYPAHIRRVSAPPRHPSGHMPHVRPRGGFNAPGHHNQTPGHGPQRSIWHNPGKAIPFGNTPNRPGVAPSSRPGAGPSSRPGAGPSSRPSAGPSSRPSAGPSSRPGSGSPGSHGGGGFHNGGRHH